MVEKFGSQKKNKLRTRRQSKENEDDRWDRADNFTKILTRSGKQRKVLSRATSCDTNKSKKSAKKNRRRSASVFSIKKEKKETKNAGLRAEERFLVGCIYDLMKIE